MSVLENFTLTGQSCLGLLHRIVFWIPSLIVSLLRLLNFGIYIWAKLREALNYMLYGLIFISKIQFGGTKDVRLKSKNFFFYPVRDEKVFLHISNLFLSAVLKSLMLIKKSKNSIHYSSLHERVLEYKKTALCLMFTWDTVNLS